MKKINNAIYLLGADLLGRIFNSIYFIKELKKIENIFFIKFKSQFRFFIHEQADYRSNI